MTQKNSIMKHLYILLTTLLISSLGFGQSSPINETFSNLGPYGGYQTETWTGDDGGTWTATDARTDQTLNGKAICIRDGVLTSPTVSGGIGSLTVTTNRAYSGGSGNMDLRVNGSSVGSIPYDGIEQTTTINNINITGNVVIEIDATNSSSDRPIIDDLQWTAFSSVTPTISFDSSTSSESETDSSFNTLIPVTLANYSADVTVSVSVNGASTAEAGDYTLNTTSLTFTGDGTQNISLDIHDDADYEDETVILELAVSSGTADLGTSQHTVTILDDDSPPAPSLIITEVADPGDDYTGRFVEIYNNGTTSIDLDSEGIYLGIQSNGGSISSTALTGILPANSILIVGNSSNINTLYGFDADVDYGTINGNGDDGYFLYYGGDETTGFVLDAYGVVNLDGSGEAWEYTDSRAVRNNPKTTLPNPTWTASEWTITSADIADMTPGALENEYRYDGVWKPRDISNATVSDDFVVQSSTTLTTDVSVNTITIDSGSTLTIDVGVGLTTETLTNRGTVVLNSSSSNYSSLLANSITNTGNINYNRYTALVGPTGSNDLVAAPLSGETFGTFASANPNLATSGTTAAFAPFNTGTGVYENYDTSTNSATTLSTGTGYRAATTDGSPLAFTGTVETGTVTVGITDGSSSFWNLVGNPYPSYLDLGDFLAANAATTVIDGTYYGVYGYDGNASDGWTVWDLNANQDNLIAPGQGFFVAAPSGGGTNITFTPAMRRSGSADDFITGRVADANFAQAILNLNTAASTYTTNLYFRDTNTRGLDPGYDTGAYDGTANGIYSQLVQDNTGVNLYNQSLPYSDLDTIVVPLAVNASQGVQLTFALNTTSELPSDINVFLEDNVANTWTLLNNQDYILTPSQDLNGAGRFYLHVSNSTLSNTDQTLNGLQVYVQRQTLVIHGPLPRATTLALYDIQGRQVLQHLLDIEQTQQSINVAGLASGVYVVQLQNGTQVRTQKVVLH